MATELEIMNSRNTSTIILSIKIYSFSMHGTECYLTYISFET